MRSAAVSGTASAEFAATRSRSPATAGMTAVLAGRKRRVTVEIAKAVAYTSPMWISKAYGTAEHEQGADDVAGDHRQAAIPAVDEDAGQRTQDHARDRGGREGQPHLERGAARRHQRAERDDVDAIAEQRDQLAGPQQAEVAVADEAQVGRLATHAGHLGLLGRHLGRDHLRIGVREADRRGAGRVRAAPSGSCPGRWPTATAPPPASSSTRWPRRSPSPAARRRC